ncbi:MAG: YbhN family protein [Candidatus Aminicenantia bacterium]
MAVRRNLLTFLLKSIISFSIIVYIIVYRTSVPEIVSTLKRVNIYWLIVSFSLHSIGLLISAYRWQILMNAQEIKVPLIFLTKSYLVGTFFNHFLPTRFGGDVVRIYDGSRYTHSISKSSAVILVERLTGIFVLLLFAFTASLFRLDIATRVPVIWLSLALGLLGLIFMFLLFTPLVGQVINRIKAKGVLGKIIEKIISFRNSVLIYQQKRSHFIRAVFWAFLLQINVIVHYYIIGLALGIKIPLIDYFIIIPVVLMILIIPVTISGWGLREGAYIEIFKFYYITSQVAVSFSLIDVAFNLIIGLVGGVVYWLRK